MRGTIIRNTASNLLAQGVNIVTALAITPYLIRHLGQDLYGLWILVASLVGYFGLTDLGLRTAVGRFMAQHVARAEHEEINRLVVTAFGLLAATAVVASAFSLVCSLSFQHLFQVMPEQAPIARIVVLVMGLSFALRLPLEVFDGVLIGHARYDLNNGVEISAALARTALCVLLLRRGFSIVALAVSALVVQTAVGAAKMWISYHICPSLSLRPRHWSPPLIRELYGFGIWTFVVFLASQIAFQGGPLVLGSLVGMSAVAVYSIAIRLVRYALQGAGAFTGVLMPIMTGYHSIKDLANEQRLLQDSVLVSLLYAGFMVVVFLIYGGPFIRAWVGPGFEESVPVLWVLTVPMIGWILQYTFFIPAFSKGRHRFLAIAFLVDSLANLLVGVLLVKTVGLVGIAIAILCTSCITMLFITPTYVCRILRIRQLQLWRQTLVPSLGGSLIAGGVLWGLRILFEPGGLLAVGITVGGVASVYFACLYYLFVVRRWGRMPQPSAVRVAGGG
jgi:O-antigen/teichoic acid export membrane protein